MSKRTDIQRILIIGAGPIIIGQGCEFDYSGVQACRALKEEGYTIILVNSNPATIMTDPDLADATYIEPIHWQSIAKIIEQERPDAILPTMGGQTALNVTLELLERGVIAQYGIELIGANAEAIRKAEDRDLFRESMRKIGLKMPRSTMARSMEEALAAQQEIGFPTIIRPSFTLGGSGGGIAYNTEEFIEICNRGLELSPTRELLIEESVLGWKEFEMEVVRDKKDNCIIVCAIENLDAMGIHTGDSITVAPAQTLTDKEYQRMRNASIAVLREIGVETGGSNVQFAINPKDGEMFVIEMNPRVSRSSALASKATGFPIARIAAKLAVGYTLDELDNEMTSGKTPASFEPTIDYVVTKIPRFNFEKFPLADDTLTTQMKSVGEVMAIGSNFQASLQKAIRALEIDRDGLVSMADQLPIAAGEDEVRNELIEHLRIPKYDRLWYLAESFRQGLSLSDIQEYSGVDPWFLAQIKDLVEEERLLDGLTLPKITSAHLKRLKQKGFSDKRLATLLSVSEETIRDLRHQLNIRPVFKRVDSCAAEFQTETAYLYSSYLSECESLPTDRKKIIVLGGGPNRIGQGIEFDYCCVHAAMAARELGYEAIMVNCNPETVSTDYDISDRLYFEPLTLEDLLAIVEVEKPLGVVVQYGGQTPLKLARALSIAGVPILGTTPDSIDRAEDRKKFQQLLYALNLKQPNNGTVTSLEEGLALAKALDFPLIVRPSYVLGGRAMEIVRDESELISYLTAALATWGDNPVLLDRYLDNAIEVDVEAVSDGETVLIAGILEHIEQAGVHSGDSTCCLPPYSLSLDLQQELKEQMIAMTKALQVKGLCNAQFAILNNEIYVLEVNPRASRTIPFVSKAIGQPFASIAMKAMLGQSLVEQGVLSVGSPDYLSVKCAVFPFIKFPGCDPILGPEMRSTGEVMGIGDSFGLAYCKSHLAATNRFIPQEGTAFVSVRDADKPAVVSVAKQLLELGFELVATKGTAHYLHEQGVPCRQVNKVMEGRPHVVDMIKNNAIQFVINTAEGRKSIADSVMIRRSAVQSKICYTTTVAGAKAMVSALAFRSAHFVNTLQTLHKRIKKNDKISNDN
jgi:carbamoyl-phosphate synthase large subunit